MPQGPSTRFLPVPGIISTVIPFIIAGMFEDGTSILVPRSGGKDDPWARSQEVFNRRPSLIIRVWFSSPILSRRVCSTKGVAWFPLTLGDCSHSGSICLLKAASIGSVIGRALLPREGGIFVKSGGEESARIVVGRFLSNECWDHFIELFA